MAGPCGWAGTILKVDLTRGSVEKETLPPDYAVQYLGGVGFNVARLFEMVKPQTDALSPENVILFGIGPLAGTLYPGNTRTTITAKSPLTDIFGNTNVGGNFGAELKYAGYDQIVVTGRAARPLYLWIDGDTIALRDASSLWGRSTGETGLQLREELEDPEIQIMCIGPAGENLVRFASVISPPGRAAGRTGMGAVMGSKNLKAIAVRGSKSVKVARPEEFLRVCQQSSRFQAEIGRTERRYKALRGSGAPMWLDFMMQAGSGAVRNYSTTELPSWTGISGERFQVGGDYNVRKRACFSCPVSCGGFFNVRSGEFAQTFGRTPEAGITTIGLSCSVDSIPPLLKLEVLLDELGMDGISAGNLVSWAMDCYSRGLLSQEDCDGLTLDWGNYGVIIDLIHKVARREGFGDLLAEGEKRAPQRLGRGSERFMYHIKGLSPVCEDPRASRIFGASYFTASRGGDNLTANVLWVPDLLRDSDLVKATFGKFGRKKAPGDQSVEGVGEALKLGEDVTAVINAAEVCTRSGGTFEFIARALSAATGVDFSVERLLCTGERIFNLEKAFNAREGLTRANDNYSVPEKFTAEPIAAGPYQGDVFFNLEELLDRYYMARGWDVATGLPTRAKLSELGLSHIVPELEAANAVR